MNRIIYLNTKVQRLFDTQKQVQLVFSIQARTFNSRFKKNILCDSNSQQKYHISTSKQLFLNHEWSKILTKAEKIVGYPTSFLNLRYLVSDEVAHFANLLRKLMQTKHPLIKMARRFLTSNDVDTKRSLQINGLIVLLISKAAGIPRRNTHIMDGDVSDGIHNSQRAVAEIAEMIYMGSVIHKGVLDLKTVDALEFKQMDQGNKLAVLLGDFLLASACKNLSKLNNNEVVTMMSQVIADISQGLFEHSPNRKLSNLKLWYESINSNSSSLLAHSAKAAVLLVKHSTALQDLVYSFAQNLDITHKIWSDFTDFKKALTYDKSNNFMNILKNKPENIMNALLKDNYSGNTESIDFVLNDCRELFNHHYSQAMNILEILEKEPNAEPNAISSLKSILNVMKNSI